MPRLSKGAHLRLRPARPDKHQSALWVIIDDRREISTRCGPGEREKAEQVLAAYIAEKYERLAEQREPERRERRLNQILIADVIKVYLEDVAPGLARPQAVGPRAERLLEFWGDRTLSAVTGKTCQEYEKWREGKGPSVAGGKKGTGGGARRDLQDLSAAIGYHHKMGYHREVVVVPLPKRGKPRERWLTREEFAKLMHVCETTRETQEGVATRKFPLRHVARYLALAVYTGSRPGVVFTASWLPGPGRSYIDLENGLFHRLPQGNVETDKKQPPVKIVEPLRPHLEKWKVEDMACVPPQTWAVHFERRPVKDVGTALARAVSLAGIEGGVTGYTTRHTCASWLVQDGVDTRIVAEFLGTSEEMIRKHYGHLAPDYQKAAVEALNRMGVGAK